MVRLRREIEGIRPDLSILPPVWAGSSKADDVLCPSWRPLLEATPGQQVLFCGAPDWSWIVERASQGAQVTCCDLDPASARRLALTLPAELAGRVQVLDKPYGEAVFTPSAFDLIVSTDQLHRYPQAQWLVRKMQREIKVDGLLLARLVVAGGAVVPGDLASAIEHAAEPASRTSRALDTGLLALETQTQISSLWLSDDGLEALERGALDRQVGGQLAPQLEAVSSHLTVERVWVGNPLRARLARFVRYGTRPISALSQRLARLVPAFANFDPDSSDDERVVIVQARRALSHGGSTVRFG